MSYSLFTAASDFNGQLQEGIIPSDAIVQGQGYKLTVNIGLIDDNIREPEEYFLLFLNASQSPLTDTIEYASGRDCLRVSIRADQDGELLILL
jgi:hypothetical protein